MGFVPGRCARLSLSPSRAAREDEAPYEEDADCREGERTADNEHATDLYARPLPARLTG